MRGVVSDEGHPYVSMSPEMLQQLDLAQSALGQNLFAKDVGDLLDSDTPVIRIMNGSAVRKRGRLARACGDGRCATS